MPQRLSHLWVIITDMPADAVALFLLSLDLILAFVRIWFDRKIEQTTLKWVVVVVVSNVFVLFRSPSPQHFDPACFYTWRRADPD